jgi:HAD superfamily hydrolase (TIGR01459 family)
MRGTAAAGDGMARIIERLEQVGNGYAALYCDLWGCLHDGVAAFPEAVAALERFKAAGGAVLLLTNSPRPRRDVMRQLALLGVPRGCYDDVVSSGDAAQAAMAAGLVGRRVHHIGPERDLVFFEDETGVPIDVERVGLEEAEGIVCTGLFDDRRETPEDYRATILYGVNKGLKLLCANPDIVVDVGDQRIYCAGAIAAAYTEAGGTSLYFGKPHAPIYELARRRLEAARGAEVPARAILCAGDGIFTDIQGAMGEDLDSLFVTGGLAAEETGTGADRGPDPDRLRAYLAAAKLSPTASIAYLR